MPADFPPCNINREQSSHQAYPKGASLSSA